MNTEQETVSSEIWNSTTASTQNIRNTDRTAYANEILTKQEVVESTQEICDYSKMDIKKEELDIKIEDYASEKPYNCSVCEYRTDQEANLVEHMKSHAEEKCKFSSTCGYKLEDADHSVTDICPTEEKSYSCSICQFKTSTRSNLVSHMRSHSREDPYSCSDCGYRTSIKSNLVRHMKSHTGEKRYTCSVCQYKTLYKHHFVIHLRSHTGEKPYSCYNCQYKTSEKRNLVAHMQAHLGEKPYSCLDCEYRTVHKSNLVVHKRFHTGNKPFSCSSCEYRTSEKGNLRRHISRKHT